MRRRGEWPGNHRPPLKIGLQGPLLEPGGSRALPGLAIHDTMALNAPWMRAPQFFLSLGLLLPMSLVIRQHCQYRTLTFSPSDFHHPIGYPNGSRSKTEQHRAHRAHLSNATPLLDQSRRRPPPYRCAPPLHSPTSANVLHPAQSRTPILVHLSNRSRSSRADLDVLS